MEHGHMAVSIGNGVDPADPVLQKAVTAAVDQLLAHDEPSLINLNFPWIQDWPLKGTLQFAGAAAQLTVADRSPSSPALSLTAIERALKV